MIRRPLARLAVVAALGCTGAAVADVYRLDDSLTRTDPPTVQMQWLPLRGGAYSGGMQAWLRVYVNIDTRRWAGRQARIYMVLAQDGGSRVEAVWTGRGPLLDGRVVSGERALVYAGIVPGPTLEDQLKLRLRTWADWTSDSRRLDFHFELID